MTRDIHLNKNELHNDIEAVRSIREEMEAARKGIEEDLEIRLIWNDEGDEEHIVRVIVNGPNLWVTDYYDRNGNRISFATEGNKEILNYDENHDEGCALTMTAIKGVLSVLEGENPPRNFASYKSNTRARNAYLICVFLASEMVRNELLERVFLGNLRTFDQYGNITWKSYLLLYRNWSNVSKILNDGKDSVIKVSTVIEKKREDDIPDMRRGEISERCISVYCQLINTLQYMDLLQA